MGDHLSWQTTHFWQKDLNFNTTEYVTRDHLSWQTKFLWSMGWSFKTGSTVQADTLTSYTGSLHRKGHDSTNYHLYILMLPLAKEQLDYNTEDRIIWKSRSDLIKGVQLYFLL